MTVRGLITTQSGTDCISKEHGSHFARNSVFTDGPCSKFQRMFFSQINEKNIINGEDRRSLLIFILEN